MRRFLICNGVHSRPRALGWVRRAVEARRPDGILFAGGVLDRGRQYAARTATLWGLTREDGLFIEEFFRTLGQVDLFAAVIPGPVDSPLEDFLRIGMHAELEYPGLHLAHATLVENEDVAVCGMGGHVCEGVPCEMEHYSRTLAEYHLRSLWTVEKPHRILLLAVPPTGPLGGDEGSRLTGELIDSYHPSLCVVGGPTERRGVQRVASTLVINPGHLAEGWAAWLDWGRPAAEQVEFLNLRELQHAGVTADTGVGD